ncbi:hypothetical protein ABZT26_35145 [Streptomyces sp. NPDC005395]|uniref:hypothetical protein n=1 Tax=Streptomyces sp. NPDC005395 TaxID=3157042 RepID=UPI00339FCA86
MISEARVIELLREAEVFSVRRPQDGEVPMVRLCGVYVSVALDVDDDGCPAVSVQVDVSDAAAEVQVGPGGEVPLELCVNGRRVWVRQEDNLSSAPVA